MPIFKSVDPPTLFSSKFFQKLEVLQGCAWTATSRS